MNYDATFCEQWAINASAEWQNITSTAAHNLRPSVILSFSLYISSALTRVSIRRRLHDYAAVLKAFRLSVSRVALLLSQWSLAPQHAFSMCISKQLTQNIDVCAFAVWQLPIEMYTAHGVLSFLLKVKGQSDMAKGRSKFRFSDEISLHPMSHDVMWCLVNLFCQSS